MNVLHRTVRADDDAYGNGVVAPIREYGIDAIEHIAATGVVLDTQGCIATTRSGGQSRFRGQFHGAHFLDQVLDQFGVGAGKRELHGVAADLRSQYRPVQPRHGGDVVQPNERVAGDSDFGGLALHHVICPQVAAGVAHQFQRVLRWGRCEKHVLRRDQYGAAARTFLRIRWLNLRQYVVTAFGRRRTCVLLNPTA